MCANKDKTSKKRKNVSGDDASSPSKKKIKLSKEAKELKKAFKAAKAAYKEDKKNADLKKAYKSAKKAWFAVKEGKNEEELTPVKTETEEELTPMKKDVVEEKVEEKKIESSPSQQDGCTTIFLGNLPWSVDEDMVKTAFKDCGEIAAIRWGTDKETGDFKGYGHVEFSTAEACAKALKLNGQDLGGREMRIDASKPRRNAGGQGGKGGNFTGPSAVPANPEQTPRCFIGNLSYKIDEEGLKTAFKEKGMEIIDVFFLTDKETGDFYGSSFCEFKTPDQAAKAVSYAGMPVLGRPVKVDFAKPRTSNGGGAKKKFEARAPSERPAEGTDTTFFGNLSFDIDDDALKAWCKEQGAEDVVAIRWLTHKDSGEFKGCGFVQFASTESSDKVVKANGATILGRAARIDYANS